MTYFLLTCHFSSKKVIASPDIGNAMQPPYTPQIHLCCTWSIPSHSTQWSHSTRSSWLRSCFVHSTLSAHICAALCLSHQIHLTCFGILLPGYFPKRGGAKLLCSNTEKPFHVIISMFLTKTFGDMVMIPLPDQGQQSYPKNLWSPDIWMWQSQWGSIFTASTPFPAILIKHITLVRSKSVNTKRVLVTGHVSVVIEGCWGMFMWSEC